MCFVALYGQEVRKALFRKYWLFFVRCSFFFFFRTILFVINKKSFCSLDLGVYFLCCFLIRNKFYLSKVLIREGG